MQFLKSAIPAALFLSFVLTSCGSGSDAKDNPADQQDYDFWVSLEDAQFHAYDEGKYILLDIYTEWCGFCRRMNQETYGDERVQEALDKYFYPVRIDAESSEEVRFLDQVYNKQNLAHQFGVSSYPTTVFLLPNGEPIAVQPGFIEASTFYKMLNYVGSESFKNESFEQYSSSN